VSGIIQDLKQQLDMLERKIREQMALFRELQAAAVKELEKIVDAKVTEKLSVRVVKTEANVATLGGNIAKVEGNLFAVQADVIRVDAVAKDFIGNWFEKREAVRSLVEKVNASPLPPSKMLEIQAMGKKSVLELLSPEKLRLDIEAIDADLTSLQRDVRQLQGKGNPARETELRGKEEVAGWKMINAELKATQSALTGLERRLTDAEQALK
jgi:hypothetical protein